MAEFAVHSFCCNCGADRGRQPFDGYSNFFDRNDGPCRKCGADGPGEKHAVKRVKVGRWPWQRGWVNAEGERVPARPSVEGEERP